MLLIANQINLTLYIPHKTGIQENITIKNISDFVDILNNELIIMASKTFSLILATATESLENINIAYIPANMDYSLTLNF